MQSFVCRADTAKPYCDTVYCSTELKGKSYDAVIKLLPCETPPAVGLTLFSDMGKVILSETVDCSREVDVPILFKFSLVIELIHFVEVVGLQVCSTTIMVPV